MLTVQCQAAIKLRTDLHFTRPNSLKISDRVLAMGEESDRAEEPIDEFTTTPFPSHCLKRYDILYKILLIGDSSVGKTTFLHAFISDEFDPGILSTIVIDFQTKVIAANGKMIKLQIWDTSGRDQYTNLRDNFYLGAKGAIFCFDITDRNSFKNLKKWIIDVQQKTKNEDLIKMIVALKCEDEDLRQVGKEEAQMFAISQQARYCEASSKLLQDVEAPFTHMASSILSLEEGWKPEACLRPKGSTNTSKRGKANRFVRHSGDFMRRSVNRARNIRSSWRRSNNSNELQKSNSEPNLRKSRNIKSCIVS